MLRAGASTPRLGCTFAGYLWEGGGAGEGLPSPGGVHKAVNKLAASRVASCHPPPWCGRCESVTRIGPSKVLGMRQCAVLLHVAATKTLGRGARSKFQQQIFENNPFQLMIFNVSVFVDTAVLIFQLFFVSIWLFTRNKMAVNHNLEFFFNSLMALVFVYMIVRFLSWSWKLVCFTCGFIYNNIKTNYTKKAETPANNILYNVFNQNFPAMVEYYLYYFGIIVFFGIIIGMLNINNTPERSVIFKEQTMYQSSSLDKVNQLPVDSKRDCVVPDSYFKNEFMNKEMCKKNDGIEKGGKYNPVGMKVFSWTRFLVLQDVLPSGKLNGIACKDSCPPSSLLFCANGFEQKWGQCKYGVNGVLPSPFTWNGLKKTPT